MTEDRLENFFKFLRGIIDSKANDISKADPDSIIKLSNQSAQLTTIYFEFKDMMSEFKDVSRQLKVSQWKEHQATRLLKAKENEYDEAIKRIKELM